MSRTSNNNSNNKHTKVIIKQQESVVHKFASRTGLNNDRRQDLQILNNNTFSNFFYDSFYMIESHKAVCNN